MNLVLALGLVIAVASAARSTWSPCGVSMLSTITPVTEKARGRSYAATVPWYVLGAIAGGATLGLIAATLSVPVRSFDIPSSAAVALVGVFSVVSVLSDLKVGGFQLPRHGRQVDRRWLDHYRSWVYGTGFGWQIGVGLATYIVTSAVYLTVAIAALTGSAGLAMLIGVIFGTVRGLAIFLGVRATTLEALHALHRRLHEFEPASRVLMFTVQALVAAVAVGAAWGWGGGIATAIVLAGLGIQSFRSGVTRPTAPERSPAVV
jgi:MFS family permease